MPVVDFHHVGCRCKQKDGFASSDAHVHYPPDLSLEPVHNTVELLVDIDAATASGVVTTTVVARRDGAQDLVLDAIDFGDVRVSDTAGHEVSWRYDGLKIHIRWAKPFAQGESRSAAVRYGVSNPSAGLYFSKPDAAYPDAGYWAATDHETERARHWYPCVDLPSVRVKLDFHLRARADLTILANGQLKSETAHDDGTKTAHWALDFPCPSYITCFAIGKFTRADDGEFQGLPLAYFGAHYQKAEDLQRSFGQTRAMLEWMTAKWDMPFPFPKYYQFALPGIGGAMENISLVSWDEIFVLDQRLATEWQWLVDQINVHEMGHSYFGDAVVCRDFAHAWLKESWATYTESLWLEDSKGAEEFAYDFYRNAQAYFDEADNQYKRPLVTRKFDSSWDMYDRHLYPGGACRLHTLRKHLGDETFFAGVRAYLKQYAGKVVETDDFRRVLEGHSGRSLGKFFDQWVHSEDYPHLGVEYGWDADKKQVTLDVTQKQVADGKGTTFELALEMLWSTSGQTHRRTLALTKAAQRFVIGMDAEPDYLTIDPDGTTLHKLEFNPGQEKLVAELENGTVLGRIHAAHELAKKPTPKNVRLLHDAWQREAFWGVRQQLVAAIAGTKTAEAMRALAHIVTHEKDPMVIGFVLTKVRALQEEAIWSATEQRLDAGDLPYWATREAWWAQGYKRESANVEALHEAARTSGWAGIAASGAIEALAESRNVAAVKPLMDCTQPGHAPHRNRANAYRALGRLGAYLEKRDRERVIEFCIKGLRDSHRSVQRAAVDALASLKAGHSAGAIEAYAHTLSHQEKVGVLRTLEALRTPENAKVAALEREIEELRKASKKLEERLSKLEEN